MVTVGLDLHKRCITACALDDAGTVLAEHRRLEPSLDALGRWLSALLTTQIQALDRHIKQTVRRDATARRLQTIPGIGPFGALLLQAEIGPIARFGSAQELAAYAGLVPSTRSSGEKTRHGHVGRGNPWLKGLLIEALQTLKLAPGPVGAHYQKLLRAKGKPKATVAAARKFCTYLYWMLKEEWSYTEWLRQHDRSEVRPMQPLGSAA